MIAFFKVLASNNHLICSFPFKLTSKGFFLYLTRLATNTTLENPILFQEDLLKEKIIITKSSLCLFIYKNHVKA